jgi:hypothetical protein
MAPDGPEIAAAASEIREGWSAARLAQNELRAILEIPEAHRVTDHMRRNDSDHESRK